MTVRVRINGREFTLSWEEFEKINTYHCIDILDIREKGGSYATA